MTHYNKPPKSIDELYNLLVQRGMDMSYEVESEVKKDLEHIGYYRLTGYLKYFQEPSNNFFPGTTFQKVLDHYIFDRKLRLLTFDAIEKIEISLKSNINNYMSLQYGMFWYLDTSLFNLSSSKSQSQYQKFIQKVTEIEQNRRALFVKVYFQKYTSETHIPCWMLMEELTLGEISTVYSLLNFPIKQVISSTIYGTYGKDMETWITLLYTLRNISAHHARLWNKQYVTKLKITDVIFRPYFQTEINPGNGVNEVKANYYNSTLVIAYLLEKINLNFGWIDDLERLFIKYDGKVDIGKMGFTPNWKEEIRNILNNII